MQTKHLTKGNINPWFKKNTQHSNKKPEEPELEENFHNVKNIYKKPTPNIMLIGKKPDAFHPISWIRQGSPLSLSLFNFVLASPNQCNKQRKWKV